MKVPAGVENGNRIQMSGQGEVGPGGGPAGDLYIEIIERPDDLLVRDGNTLHASISIPFTSAALGGEVLIPTLDGEQKVTIKPGTQSGSTIVLKQLGITHLRSGGRGDLIVHVDVTTPSKLKKDEEELLKKLAQMRNEKGDSVSIHKRDEKEHGFFARFRDAFGR